MASKLRCTNNTFFFRLIHVHKVIILGVSTYISFRMIVTKSVCFLFAIVKYVAYVR